MAQVLDGNEASASLKERVEEVVSMLRRQRGVHPHLQAILVGDDPASKTYVGRKEAGCNDVGISFAKDHLDSDVSGQELIEMVSEYSSDPSIHGILVQLPLPDEIEEREVIDHIHPLKDVDGLTSENKLRLYTGEEGLRPATPVGILELADYYGISWHGRRVTIVGRGKLVGKPLAQMINEEGEGATVTTCHKYTEDSDLELYTRQAEILVTGVGRRPESLANPEEGLRITGDMVSDDDLVAAITAGWSKVPDPSKPNGYRILGDLVHDEVKEKADYITPATGGVGPMTVAAVLRNVVDACYAQLERDDLFQYSTSVSVPREITSDSSRT